MEFFFTTILAVAVKLIVNQVASQASEALSEQPADESLIEAVLDFFFD